MNFERAKAITPSDSADLTEPADGIYVGGAGAIRCILFGDTVPQTFAAVPVGTVLRMKVSRVYATSTTATLMLALYNPLKQPA